MANERNCLNCRYCKVIDDIIACREEPGVVDHAFNISVDKAASHVCDNFHSKDTMHYFRNIRRDQLVELVKDAINELGSENQYKTFTIMIDTEADASFVGGNNTETAPCR